jgi:hypothetical protein
MPPESSTLPAATGYVYLIQLLPKALPSRLKMGWTITPRRRLRFHRCTCPEARIVRVWRCHQGMEREALRAVLAAGFRRVGREVFDAPDVAAFVAVVDVRFAAVGIRGSRAAPHDPSPGQGGRVRYEWSRSRRWPQPRLAPSGTWHVQITLGGQRRFVSAATREDAVARMRALDKDYRRKLVEVELPDGADVSGLF